MPYTSEEMPEVKTAEGTVTIIQPEIKDRPDLKNDYINLLNSAPHVISPEEVVKFSTNTKGVNFAHWTDTALNKAIEHVKTLIKEREYLLESESINAKINANEK